MFLTENYITLEIYLIYHHQYYGDFKDHPLDINLFNFNFIYKPGCVPSGLKKGEGKKKGRKGEGGGGDVRSKELHSTIYVNSKVF